jgi:hypothetical protein
LKLEKIERMTVKLRTKKLCIFLVTLFFVSFLPLADASVSVSVVSPTEGGSYTRDVKLVIAASWVADDFYEMSSLGVSVYLDNEYYVGSTITGSAEIPLTGLSQGMHKLEVQVEARVTKTQFSLGTDSFFVLDQVIQFKVDYGVPPILTILGLEKYDTSDAMFSITTDYPVSTLMYSLDNQNQAVIPNSSFADYEGGTMCNLTLTSLAGGQHTLTIYAYDSLGHHSNATKSFTINTGNTMPTQGQTPSQSNFLLTIAIFTAAIAAGVLAFAILMLRRHHTKKEEQLPLQGELVPLEFFAFLWRKKQMIHGFTYTPTRLMHGFMQGVWRKKLIPHRNSN